jgi:hypothetical protein
MNRKLAVITAVTALGAAAIPATAAEQPKIRNAYFKVTIEGVQKDKWNAFHQGGAHKCDATVSQKGSEVVKFRSKPILIKATDMEGLSNPVFSHGDGSSLYPFKLRGTVSRQSQINASPTPPECGGKGGGGIPKDCGTKPLRGLKARADYALGKPYGYIQIQSDSSARDPFRNCGGGSQGFPHLLDYTAQNKRIDSELPRNEVFDKSLGKIIVIGRGRSVQKGEETEDIASIRWEVTLKRVKR